MVRLAIDVLPRWLYKPREKCLNFFCVPTIPHIVSAVTALLVHMHSHKFCHGQEFSADL
jgi:hypothetical protein